MAFYPQVADAWVVLDFSRLITGNTCYRIVKGVDVKQFKEFFQEWKHGYFVCLLS